jgi:MFS family permease
VDSEPVSPYPSPIPPNNPNAGGPAPAEIPGADWALYRRVAFRVVPLLFAAYVAAYLNRVNVGFARLQMVSELRFSDTVYGLGAGIFFIGYLIFEVPSNAVLSRVGARLWIGRIMITWSLVSAATMFVRTPFQFYLSRFLLGAAEAGFFPGMIFFLTQWFPARARARITAWLITGIAASGVVGGPVSGWIMNGLSGCGGLSGWKWLFALEAVPTLLLGFAILAWLPDSIGRAAWLNPREKAVLEEALAREAATKAHLPLARVFTHPTVWVLSLVYFFMMVGLYGVSFWMPQIISNTGIRSVASIGLLSAIPYAAAAASAVAVGTHSDRTGERHWHCVLCLLSAAVGFALIGLARTNAAAAVLGLVLATSGVLSALPLFWTYPAALLGGLAAAVGIALINSVGNLGGFACPYIVGALNDATKSQGPGLYFLSGSLAVGAAIVLSQMGPGKHGRGSAP